MHGPYAGYILAARDGSKLDLRTGVILSFNCPLLQRVWYISALFTAFICQRELLFKIVERRPSSLLVDSSTASQQAEQNRKTSSMASRLLRQPCGSSLSVISMSIGGVRTSSSRLSSVTASVLSRQCRADLWSWNGPATRPTKVLAAKKSV